MNLYMAERQKSNTFQSHNTQLKQDVETLKQEVDHIASLHEKESRFSSEQKDEIFRILESKKELKQNSNTLEYKVKIQQEQMANQQRKINSLEECLHKTNTTLERQKTMYAEDVPDLVDENMALKDLVSS